MQKSREGAKYDTDNLRNTLNLLGFDVVCYENLTTTEHHYGKILFDGNGEKVNLTGTFFISKVEAHLLFHLKKNSCFSL